MNLNVGRELAVLQRMTVAELRARYQEIFDEQTSARNKQWLIKRMIWRLQSLEEGGLSERARKRAMELANDADIRSSPPKEKELDCTPIPSNQDQRLPIPGTVLIRQYKNQRIEVGVESDGFEYQGQKFKSLSAVAKHITGSHCNGYRFFRINQEESQ